MPKRDWEAWMWRQAEDLFREAENIQWNFLQTAAAARSASLLGHPSWGPAVNVIETEDSFCVLFSLPGVDAEDVTIELSDQWIRLTGRRCLPEEACRGSVHVLEIPSGPFERRLRIPPGLKLELKEKVLANGILTLEMRKVQ